VKNLKLALLIGLAISLAAAPILARDHLSSRTVVITDDENDRWERTSFDLDKGAIIITHREDRRRDVVEVGDDSTLVINGEEVKLNERQKALVGEFHVSCMDIYESAKKIGWEGAKIGVDGAKLGFQAIGCVFKLLSPDYDSDDMERELEREAAKIEAKADILEMKADRIEEMANELEDLTRDMRRAIPEIDALDWF